MRALTSLGLVGSLVLVACSSGSGGGGGSGGSAGQYGTARSPTCKAMADAFCDWAFDQCHKGTSRAECDEDASSLFCKSDELAQGCIDSLPALACSESASACAAAIDPTPAISYCGELTNKYCQSVSPCEGMSYDDCMVSAAGTCGSAIGVGATGDQCLSELTGIACGAALPASCEGVIKQAGP